MKPQLKDFLLYLLILIVAIIGVVFVFSANNSSKNEIPAEEIKIDKIEIKGE